MNSVTPNKCWHASSFQRFGHFLEDVDLVNVRVFVNLAAFRVDHTHVGQVLCLGWNASECRANRQTLGKTPNTNWFFYPSVSGNYRSIKTPSLTNPQENNRICSLPRLRRMNVSTIQCGLASLSSLQASAQVLLKSNALDLISFQLRPIKYSSNEFL